MAVMAKFSKLVDAVATSTQKKFGKVMKEFYNKKLHHGSTGDIVTDVNVAKAIAASESGMPKKKKGRA